VIVRNGEVELRDLGSEEQRRGLRLCLMAEDDGCVDGDGDGGRGKG
jgi:hypothetical protein